MDPIYIEGPDGRLIEFPADTPQEAIVAAMSQAYPADREYPAPQEMNLPGTTLEEVHAEMQRRGPHNGYVLSGEDGARPTTAQGQYYDRQREGGYQYGPETVWGTREAPFPEFDGRRPSQPGQYYLDLDGNLVQVPGEVKPDHGLGFVEGALQPLNTAAGWLEDGVGVVIGRENLDNFNEWTKNFGMAGSVDEAEANQQAMFARELARGRRPSWQGRLGGNIAATAAMTAPFAGAGLPGAITSGGASGALLTPDRDDPMATLQSAGLGAVTGAVLDRGGRFFTEAPIADPIKQALYRGDVPLTPGQMIPGFEGVEQFAARTGFVPGVRGRLRESYNGMANFAAQNGDEGLAASMRAQARGVGRDDALTRGLGMGSMADSLGVINVSAPAWAAKPLAAATATYSPIGSRVLRESLMAERPAALQFLGRQAERTNASGLFGSSFYNGVRDRGPITMYEEYAPYQDDPYRP